MMEILKHNTRLK